LQLMEIVGGVYIDMLNRAGLTYLWGADWGGLGRQVNKDLQLLFLRVMGLSVFEGFRKAYYRRLLELCARALEERGWKVEISDDVDGARKIVLGLVKGGESVGIPGSTTVRELGVMEPLSEKCRVVHHWIDAPSEVKNRLRREEVGCDVFIHSPNAVSLDGYVVVCDAFGNRVAGSVLGPKKLIFVAGRNKLTENIWSAVERARKVASGINAARFGKSADDIRYLTLILEKAPLAIPQSYFVLVNRDLGF